MNRYYYDLHLHSCLSPCADNDMTPNNIAGMAALAGLNIVALTDHNSSRNCPAFFAAAKKQGIIPIAGMELTTAEDIHIVCLFESLTDALAFNDVIDTKRVRIPNRVDIFGDQWIMDENDSVVASEADLLSNATTLTLDDVPPLVHKHSGICYPAHVDREANGLIATLGTFPISPVFGVSEFHDEDKVEAYRKLHPKLNEMRIVISSDAHYLWDIRDKKHYFELDDEPYSSDRVRREMFRMLKGELS
ncbi:MAG: PHP domain-containing protein [Ruminococcaceae bacterium]|nr:PHP domain-containing protein [Oscillospiraceae bacterium]